MKSLFLLSKLSIIVVTALILSGCTMHQPWQEAAPKVVKEQKIDGLPYHPMVYHLDLSILAYQLYAQSLAWPFDPYYEELEDDQRVAFMRQVQGWAAAKGPKQARESDQKSIVRGPGILGNFDHNAAHDPILFRYHHINPHHETITNVAGRWTEYRTPKVITNRIKEVYVCYRRTGGTGRDLIMKRLPRKSGNPAAGASDILIAFEGSTGDKGEPGQPSSQSLMGFVLLRQHPGSTRYDTHIAFRGSRSGSASRALFQAISTSSASGNPDWITDLGYRQIKGSKEAPTISTVGTVSRGFARSMESILPQLIQSLQKGVTLKNGRSPENIFVTGHSLGGALAQHFVSAIHLGDRYGPGGVGPMMPKPLKRWPWKQMKLITYGSPVAGDLEWAQHLSERTLKSDLFDGVIDPYDRNALPVAHPSIIPRLFNKGKAAGFRVLMSRDPITTKKFTGGKHVGKTVYLNQPPFPYLIGAWSTDEHEPKETRDSILASLQDSRIPKTAWNYHKMAAFNPSADPSSRGTLSEYQKLKDAVIQYHKQRKQKLDLPQMERDFKIFAHLLKRMNQE